MSTKRFHLISESGQIIQRTVSEQLITNPQAILTQFIATARSEEEGNLGTDPADASIRSLYNLGDGVSAFRQKIAGKMYYWNSIQLESLSFFTEWELQQDPAVNNGKHFICPWNGGSKDHFSIGAPMDFPIPSELIVHFHVEYKRHPTAVDIQLPEAHQIYDSARELVSGMSNYYLTCYSQSRNTCLSLPLPNLYPDCHLCTGTSFSDDGFYKRENHAGLVNSARHFLKTWSDTAWNCDLLGGPKAIKMAQYRRFVRFDADSGKPLAFSGDTDWDISTSRVPLEEVYKPWSKASQAVQPKRRPEDADLVDTVEAPEEREVL